MQQSRIILETHSNIKAPLDPEFIPCSLANRNYRKAVSSSPKKEKVIVAIEREKIAPTDSTGLVRRWETEVFPQGVNDFDTLLYIDRSIKFLLWACGGWKIHFSGPSHIGEYLQRTFSPNGNRKFDIDLMQKVYEKPFEVSITKADNIPQGKEMSQAIGRHLDGCRIGFDLGASDFKISSVIDGNPVFSVELPWNPKDADDYMYHFSEIQKGLEAAAGRLPKVDAIGGSSAGVWINNRVMVASLFRSIPQKDFDAHVKDMFINLGKEWGVPLVVINDGDVTALAGGMSLDKNALLGVAMGSSQAAGYLDPQGKILGWLNELAFAPIDYNPKAASDEWSGDIGVGVMYFSQQAVNKLAVNAGITFEDSMPLPERLVKVQELMKKGDEKVRQIYETIGVYLGYAVPHYCDFYDIENILTLGRVTSGPGGDIIIEKAKQVLAEEFPDLAKGISIQLPDERSRRVGQSIAAASLPVIEK